MYKSLLKSFRRNELRAYPTDSLNTLPILCIWIVEAKKTESRRLLTRLIKFVGPPNLLSITYFCWPNRWIPKFFPTHAPIFFHHGFSALLHCGSLLRWPLQWGCGVPPRLALGSSCGITCDMAACPDATVGLPNSISALTTSASMRKNARENDIRTHMSFSTRMSLGGLF